MLVGEFRYLLELKCILFGDVYQTAAAQMGHIGVSRVLTQAKILLQAHSQVLLRIIMYLANIKTSTQVLPSLDFSLFRSFKNLQLLALS